MSGESVRGIGIRNELRSGDVEAIVRMHADLYGKEQGFDAGFEAHVEEPLRRFARSPSVRSRIWIAQQEGAIVGCIAIVEVSTEEAQLRWFLVDPSARGQGLGSSLLRIAVDFARDRGYRSIFLWTVSALEAASRLYVAAGFTKVEEKPGNFGVPVVEEKFVLPLRG